MKNEKTSTHRKNTSKGGWESGPSKHREALEGHEQECPEGWVFKSVATLGKMAWKRFRDWGGGGVVRLTLEQLLQHPTSLLVSHSAPCMYFLRISMAHGRILGVRR